MTNLKNFTQKLKKKIKKAGEDAAKKVNDKQYSTDNKKEAVEEFKKEFSNKLKK